MGSGIDWSKYNNLIKKKLNIFGCEKVKFLLDVGNTAARIQSTSRISWSIPSTWRGEGIYTIYLYNQLIYPLYQTRRRYIYTILNLPLESADLSSTRRGEGICTIYTLESADLYQTWRRWINTCTHICTVVISIFQSPKLKTGYRHENQF